MTGEPAPEVRSNTAVADAEAIRDWRRRGNIAIGLSLAVTVLSVIALVISLSTRQDLAPNVSGGANTCFGGNSASCDRACLANQPRLVVVDNGEVLKVYCQHSNQTPATDATIPPPGAPGGVPVTVVGR